MESEMGGLDEEGLEIEGGGGSCCLFFFFCLLGGWVGLDHFLRLYQHHSAPNAPCAMLCFVPVRLGWCDVVML